MKTFPQYFIAIILFSILFGQDSNITNKVDRQKAHEYMAVKLESPLKIDGILDEPRYQGKSISDFIQTDPVNGAAPSQETEVWISYTKTALYISARLHDTDAGLIRNPKSRRDQLENSDEFQIAIDSYHDKRSGYLFVVTPSGSFGDGTAFNDSDMDFSWDGIWYRSVSQDENGWSVEVEIPFSQLRFELADEQIMGIGFGRQIDRNKEHVLDFYIPSGESGLVSRFNNLRGIKNINPPRKIEIIPYTTGGYSIVPGLDDHPLYNGHDSKMGFGTDVKIGLGSNLTLSGSINPDFGQVEVDPSVINLSANETYYSEKRPFFVEGANIFSFGRGGPSNRMSFMYMQPDFFYSRRIGASPRGELSLPMELDQDINGQDYEIYEKIERETTILGAAKITGRLNKNWSTGIFSAITAEEKGGGRVIDINSREELGRWNETIEPGSGYYLARMLGEFNEGLQGVGIIGSIVNRTLKTPKLDSLFVSRAFTSGVDGWAFLNKDKSWVVSGWMGFSQVSSSPEKMVSIQRNSRHYFQRPDADYLKVDSSMTEMTGYSGRLVLTKETGNVIFNVSSAVTSSGFEPNDMGLLFNTDRIHNQLVLGYSWNDPTKYFNYGRLVVAKAVNHNFAGQKINSMNFITGFIKFHNDWKTHFIGGFGPRTLSDRTLRGGPMVISPIEWFSNLNIRSDSRKAIQYSFSVSGGGSEKGGKEISFGPEIEIQAGPQLKLEMEPSYSKNRSISQYVDEFDDPTRIAMYGKRYIVSQLDQERLSMEIRADLTLTPELSIQSYIQPFIAVGHYSHFKEYDQPETYSFFEYGEDQDKYNIHYDVENEEYVLQPGGKNSEKFYLGNPDFNVKSLIGNFVLRWEFRPGSTLFLVWTRSNENDSNPGSFKFNRDVGDLFGSKPDNHFAVKLTYWFGQ